MDDIPDKCFVQVTEVTLGDYRQPAATCVLSRVKNHRQALTPESFSQPNRRFDLYTSASFDAQALPSIARPEMDKIHHD